MKPLLVLITFLIAQSSIAEIGITPTARTFTRDGGGAAIIVSGSGAWQVSTEASWITLFTTSGNGAGTIAYLASANTSADTRQGTILIDDKVFTVTQNGYDSSISPVFSDFSEAGGNGMVNVTVGPGISWSAVADVSWIQVDSASGLSSGQVNYTVLPYEGVQPRFGSITIAGKTFDVTQTGGDLALSPSSASVTYQATAIPNIGVEALSSTTWSVQSNASWISVVDAGRGSGDSAITLGVGENPSYLERVGTVSIGSKTFTITQEGTPNLRLEINPTEATADASGAVGNVAVLATPDAPWSAESLAPWIIVSQGETGAGNGNIRYVVSPNTNLEERTGQIKINPPVPPALPDLQRGLQFDFGPNVRGIGNDNSGWRRYLSADNTLTGRPLSRQTNAFSMVVDFEVQALNSIKRLSEVTLPDGSYSTIWVNSSNEVVFRSGSEELKSAPLPAIGSYRAYVTASESDEVHLVVFSDLSADEDPLIISSVSDQFTQPPFPVDIELGDIVLNKSNVPSVGQIRDARITRYKLYDRALTQREIEKYDNNNEAYVPVEPAPYRHFNLNGSLNKNLVFVDVTNGLGGFSGQRAINGFTGNTIEFDYEGLNREDQFIELDFAVTINQGSSYGTFLSIGDSDGWPSISLSNSFFTVDVASGVQYNQSFPVLPLGQWHNINLKVGFRETILRVQGQTYTLDTPSNFPNGLIKFGSGLQSWIDSQQNSVNGIISDLSITNEKSDFAAISGDQPVPAVQDRNGMDSGAIKIDEDTSLTIPISSERSLAQWIRIDADSDQESIINFGSGFSVGIQDQSLVVTGLVEIYNYGIDGNLRSGEFHFNNENRFATYAMIKHPLQNTSLMNHLSQNGDRQLYYIALRNNGVGWAWKDGSQLDYSNWAPTFPRSGHSYAYIDKFTGLWYSTDGRENLQAIEEVSIAETLGIAGGPIYQVQEGLWFHLAYVVQDDGFYQYFIDGEEVTSGTVGSFSQYTTSFDGAIDMVSTYSEALTSAQVRAIYESQKPQTIFHTVTQGAFEPSIEPSQVTLSSTGGSATTNLILADNVQWTATTSTPWLNITSSTTGAGSAEIRVTASRNPTVYERTGTVLVAGQTFSVIQAGLNVDLEYESRTFRAAGGDLTIDVNTEAGAAWEVTSDVDWIIPVLPQGGQGTGSGSAFVIIFQYTNTTSSRTGTLYIAGQEVIISQRGYDLSVSPQVAEVGSNAGAGEFGVSAPLTAVWEAIVTEPWITLIGGQDGQGNGTVRYSVGSNTTGAPRTGKIIVAGEEYVITQYAGIDVTVTAASNGATSGTGSYETNAIATLTATADQGYVFSHWTGDAVGSDNPLELIVDSTKNVVANFIPDSAVVQFQQPFLAQIQEKDEVIEQKNTQLQANTLTIEDLQNGINTFAAANIALQASYDNAIAERDARFVDSDEDGITDVKEVELETDPQEVTAFYLEAPDPTAIEAARLAGQSEVLNAPQSFNLYTSLQYNSIVAERDARPTQVAYNTVVAQRDARPTLEEVKDARLGSVLLLPNATTNKVKLRFTIEESNDLGAWTSRTEEAEVDIPLDPGKKFFRFSVKEDDQ